MGSRDEFILRNRALDFEERAEAERITDAVVNDPEGAAWTIVVLRSILARNGVGIEVMLSVPSSPEGGNGK